MGGTRGAEEQCPLGLRIRQTDTWCLLRNRGGQALEELGSEEGTADRESARSGVVLEWFCSANVQGGAWRNPFWNAA